MADEPVSRILYAVPDCAGTTQPRRARRGDHSSRSRIASGLKQPTRGSERVALASEARTGRASPPLLFGLAPRGVFRAPGIAVGAVGSYPTFSPLPNDLTSRGELAVFPQACRRGPSITGGLFSVALSVVASLDSLSLIA